MAIAVKNSEGSSATIDIELAQMAAHVERQLALAIEAFARRDISAAEGIIAADERIDRQQQTIEEKLVIEMAASRLTPARAREIAMQLKMVGKLERVGDLAKNVAKRTLVVSLEDFAQRTAGGVASMGRTALRQFSTVLNAYTSSDAVAAKAVWSGDDDLDELYNSVFGEIMSEMMLHPSKMNVGAHLLFIAKNFERVGDHATSIAEALHYALTGVQLTTKRPKGDETPTTVFVHPQGDDSGFADQTKK
ncbi:MAG: phosphate signaling complex protein PhoU [Pseudomonadota bacterium]